MIRIRSLVVLAAALAAGATVNGAAAQQRCEGTLCDLYYRGSAPDQPAPAQPAAPTPMTAASLPSLSGAGSAITNLFSGGDAAGAQAAASSPQAAPAGQQAAPQREGYVRMGGGGVTGQRPQGGCGGTICDLLHGHSSEDESGASVSQSVNGVPQSRFGAETASAEPVAAPAGPAPVEAAAPQPAQRRVAVRAEPKPPACASKAADPWACYRR